MKLKQKTYNLKERIQRTEALYGALEEAAYEGNIGAVEVATFYMNADDGQIEEFEAELESGNETGAWDVIQRYHGVNLVGLGSDQSSDVESAINEYFNKNKEVLTYESLCEMVREAVVKQEALPTDKEGLVNVIISHLSNQFPDIEPKMKDGKVVGITNVGGRFVRFEFAEEVRIIMKKEYGVDVNVNLDDERVARSLSFPKMSKIYIFQGGGSGKESTYFEANLVVAMNGGEHNGAEFKKTEKINQDPRYHEAAVKCVEELRKQGMPADKAVQASGGAAKGTLSDTFTRWGVTSREAKADISLGNLGVSVKKAEESQFMSAQGPECAAVFDVVFKNNPNLVEYGEKQVDQFLTQMKRLMGTDKPKDFDKKVANAFTAATGDEKDAAGSALDRELGDKTGNVGVAYQAKDAVGAAMDDASDDLKKQYGNAAGDLTDRNKGVVFQKMIKKAVHLDCESEISPEEEAIIDGVISDLGVEGAEPFVKMAAGLEKVMSSEAFRVGVIKEGLTGDGKFVNDEAKANAILKWSIASADNSRWIVLFDEGGYNDAVFQQMAKNLKLDIRDRGDRRGLALRGDAVADAACNNKMPEISEGLIQGVYDIDMSSYAAYDFSEDELSEIREVSDVFYKAYTTDELIMENIMENWISSLVSKGIDVAKKGADWVKSKYESAMKAVSESLAKLWGWIKSLLKASFSKVLQVFGFAPEQSQFQLEY